MILSELAQYFGDEEKAEQALLEKGILKQYRHVLSVETDG